MASLARVVSVDLVCVNPTDVQKVWPLARDLIRAAIERTELSDFADIEKDVLSGDQLLWLAISDRVEAAATTHLSRNVCTLTACSGHQRERWLPLFARIEKYAKDEGCSTMRIYGRKGWERVLDGYKAEYVILEKSLGR
jgi:hypothetical protein